MLFFLQVTKVVRYVLRMRTRKIGQLSPDYICLILAATSHVKDIANPSRRLNYCSSTYLLNRICSISRGLDFLLHRFPLHDRFWHLFWSVPGGKIFTFLLGHRRFVPLVGAWDIQLSLVQSSFFGPRLACYFLEIKSFMGIGIFNPQNLLDNIALISAHKI